MTTDSALPFKLNQDALAKWLDGLSRSPHAQAAHQLNLALKQLKDEKCPPDELLQLLINLTPLTVHFSNSLSSAATSEADLTGKPLKLGKLSMQLPRQLALLFCQLVESNKLDAMAQHAAIYHALQLIGYCLRSYCLFYEMPSATLWKKSALLFKLAAASASLSLAQSPKFPEFKTQANIASVIKRNLLFCIMSPSLYKPDEINQFFQLANQCADLLDIETSRETMNFGFYWDLEKDLPPCPVKKNNRPLPAGHIAINSRRLSHELQLGTLATQINPSTQNKLALLLSGYHQVFGSIIPGLPSRSRMIAGFTGACHYLQELNKLFKINQLSAQLRDAKSHSRHLSLVPLEHQRNVFEMDDRPFADQTIMGKSVNLHKTPNKLYWVAESRTLDCATGDIVLLYKEQHPVTVAVIRQQNFNELSNAQQLLLEFIPGGCTIYNLANSAIDAYALVIGEDSDNPQVFLASGKQSLPGKIPLSVGKSLRLTACLESSSYFSRFRCIFEA